MKRLWRVRASLDLEFEVESSLSEAMISQFLMRNSTLDLEYMLREMRKIEGITSIDLVDEGLDVEDFEEELT